MRHLGVTSVRLRVTDWNAAYAGRGVLGSQLLKQGEVVGLRISPSPPPQVVPGIGSLQSSYI